MRFLEYMGFVLAAFPLKYGFIIVQSSLYPNYNVDQSTTSVYIYGIVLWLGKYRDIIILPCGTIRGCKIQTGSHTPSRAVWTAVH